MKPATKAQSLALRAILENGGEAIRDGWSYLAGGRVVGTTAMVELMERKGLVRIDRVGGSSFAIPLTPTQAAISWLDHAGTRQPGRASPSVASR